MKINCWEYKQCGREPGGKVAEHMGVCPAATDARLEGINGGSKSGRACWLVAGTLCGGKPQGTFAQKVATCEHCDFFHKVRDEEKGSFMRDCPRVLEESK